MPPESITADLQAAGELSTLKILLAIKDLSADIKVLKTKLEAVERDVRQIQSATKETNDKQQTTIDDLRESLAHFKGKMALFGAGVGGGAGGLVGWLARLF